LYMVRTVDNKKNIAIDALAALVDDMNEKSEVAKLREVFGYVEMTLSSGVSREKVLETIRTTLSIKMSLKTFEKNLYRIRKKQKTENLKETKKTGEENNTGSQQLIASSGKAPETTSAAVPTQQNELVIIDGDDEESNARSLTPSDMHEHWRKKITPEDLQKQLTESK